MNAPVCRHPRQSGYMLLEVLISILLFSVGILGTIATQAVAVRSNSEARYRIDASFLANSLIARMWTGDRSPTNLQSSYGVSGSRYLAWLADVQAQLPGVTANPPTVQFTTEASGIAVTATVRWQAPGDAAVHQYVATTSIR